MVLISGHKAGNSLSIQSVMTSTPFCMGDPVTKNRREKTLAPGGCSPTIAMSARGFNQERVMMQQVIILIVLLQISFPAY
ncbi:type I toxin-antitoxin system Ibs family toxin [Salmonella enterica subsp. arizonae]|nr:type I toxin-antitoxin system Ibs family toxin [Salmonella enterica subsp. arizonae]EDX5492317.1 type I toxin-antitoxin system Ibs family toxin [Salmonella enterica subsp. arizonae]MIH92172.1 type I toxin-antitoxin system Ibs family toxin [Salmonella enterica subsp. arizonae]